MQTNSLLSWPPLYQVKRHRRARHVKLRAGRQHGLQITVPYRYNINQIPAVLEENKHWILKQLAKLTPILPAVMPQTIVLPAMNKVWQVHYMATGNTMRLIERPTQEIVLMGDVDNKKLCQLALKKWIKRVAKSFLIEQLHVVSANTQLSFAGVSVRDQATLWGSCNSKNNISLNYKLIFMPLHLVHHIMIHELCHTVHHNHSAKFWGLVASHDAAWQTHRLAMKKGDEFIPSWVSH